MSMMLGRLAKPHVLSDAEVVRTHNVQLYHSRCWYCGVELVKVHRNQQLAHAYTKDHVLARVNGGCKKTYNLVPCCLSCNKRKKALSVEAFRTRFFAGESGGFWGERLAAKLRDSQKVLQNHKPETF